MPSDPLTAKVPRMAEGATDRLAGALGRGFELRRLIRRTATSSWFWGVIVAVLAWAVVITPPQAGLDESWRTGLYLAAHEHLRWGHQIMYTYGPLGFLDYPLYAYPGLARLSYLYNLLVTLGLSAALVWALRRSFGSLWIAAPLALLIQGFPGLDPVPVVFTVGALYVLQSSPPAQRITWLAGLAGAICGLEILIKLNTGTTAVILTAVTLLVLPERRRLNLSIFVGLFVVFGLAGWLLAHQRLGDLWAFVHSSMSVVSGYSQAMGADNPGGYWEYWAAGLLLLLGVFAALSAGWFSERPRRKGLVAIWLILWFFEFKEGFVRHDTHSTLFFATLLGAFVGFRWRPGRRAIGALMLIIFTLPYFGSTHMDPHGLFEPVTRTKLFFDQTSDLTDGTTLTNEIASGRAALIATYGLDRASYDLLRGQRVDIEPWEDSLAWGYGLYWSPTPEFQAFTGYTTFLDNANAAAFARPTGAGRVLSQTPRSIDGRYPGFDAPAATRSLLCHFVPVRVTAGWEVLTRTANRCGPETPLEKVTVAYGQPVPVPIPPGPNQLVIVRITGVQVTGLLERIRTFLFRSKYRFVTLDSSTYRLIPATADDGLLVRAPVAADNPGAYRIAPDPRTIAAGVVNGSGQVTFAFSTQSIRPR